MRRRKILGIHEQLLNPLLFLLVMQALLGQVGLLLESDIVRVLGLARHLAIHHGGLRVELPVER